jgi:phosphoglycolate phosphatase-like HAD superfamily hydrolase
MVGDKLSDLEAGYNAGVKTILVKTGYGTMAAKDPALAKFAPAYVAENLLAAAEWIMSFAALAAKTQPVAKPAQ